ncbi:30S ribosomal protein S4 [Candidatus Microgenomates bacterium]|nr:30S ribosomal protein S4 [Candidatus Microgenomates bacterium]
MARTTDAVCRKCRREGTKLFLKGERCVGPKCSFTRRSYAPGQHGPGSRIRLSEYGTQLREKQKAKGIYGIFERQFANYYDKAKKVKGEAGMLSLVERRLDNVVYRLGFAPSRSAARQIVSHGHIVLNGKKNTIPSYQIKIGDKITFANPKESLAIEAMKNIKKSVPTSWLKIDNGIAEVTSLPAKEDIGGEVEERLIIEYYSR